MTSRDRISRRASLLAIGLFLVSLVPAVDDARAQERAGGSWLPENDYFRVPAAGQAEPRFTLSVISSDILDRPDGPSGRPGLGLERGQEFQIIAGLGGTIRLWRPATWQGGGLITGLQAGVLGRFLMAESANALMASDWFIAFPVEAAWNRLSGRFRFVHHSAHLGDEVIEATGIARNDFTMEALDLLAAYQGAGGVRLYGGATLVLRSQLEDAEDAPFGFTDDGGFRLGLDGAWYPWARGIAGLRGGIDLQWSDRADWRRQLSGSLGFEARQGPKAVRIGLILFDGPSPIGQFFLNGESFWGLELRVDL